MRIKLGEVWAVSGNSEPSSFTAAGGAISSDFSRSLCPITLGLLDRGTKLSLILTDAVVLKAALGV